MHLAMCLRVMIYIYWKTGKTVFAGDQIKKLLTLRPNARIAIISSRKTLTTALVADFNASDYREIKGGIFDEEQAAKHPVSVWQVESLQRISSDLKPFDLVVVDKPDALFAHVYQPNASLKARVGISSIYVSDNGLSDGLISAFRIIRPGKASKVLQNTFKSWEGVTVGVSTGLVSHDIVRMKLFEFLDEQEKLRQDGAKWSGCVIPCHSRKFAEGLVSQITERYGYSIPTKLYTSETDQSEKAEDFKDASTSWDKRRAWFILRLFRLALVPLLII
jgi:hypothetical protein